MNDRRMQAGENQERGNQGSSSQCKGPKREVSLAGARQRDIRGPCSLHMFNKKEGGMRWEAQTRSGSTQKALQEFRFYSYLTMGGQGVSTRGETLYQTLKVHFGSPSLAASVRISSCFIQVYIHKTQKTSGTQQVLHQHYNESTNIMYGI